MINEWRNFVGDSERRARRYLDLLLALYPRAHDLVDPAPVPRWRDFSEESLEPLTDALFYSGARQIGEWLLEDIGIKSDRWVQLIELFGQLAPDLRATYQIRSR